MTAKQWWIHIFPDHEPQPLADLTSEQLAELMEDAWQELARRSKERWEASR